MKEIKYETKPGTSMTVCLNPCPYGLSIMFLDKLMTINVGSSFCEQCKHFISENREKQFVTCSYEEGK